MTRTGWSGRDGEGTDRGAYVGGGSVIGHGRPDDEEQWERETVGYVDLVGGGGNTFTDMDHGQAGEEIVMMQDEQGLAELVEEAQVPSMDLDLDMMDDTNTIDLIGEPILVDMEEDEAPQRASSDASGRTAPEDVGVVVDDHDEGFADEIEILRVEGAGEEMPRMGAMDMGIF